MDNEKIEKLQENIIPATNQNNQPVYFYGDGKGFKIMFVGNSIAKHKPKPEMGWTNDCGMAASSIDKDYVHLIVDKCKKEYREDTSFCICQIASYEVTRNPAILEEKYSSVKDYNPDVVIMFFGANVPKEYDTEEKHEFPFGEAYEILRNYLNGDHTLFFHSDGFYIRPVLDEEKKIVAAKYGDTYINIEDIRTREDTHGRFNHPSDLGMAEIADRFWNAIIKKLKES